MSESPLRLPRRADDAHKGTFGKVLLVGGSRGMSGSIALSAIAALRCGSGLVTAAVPDRCLETVASYHPGVMTLPLPDDSDGRFSLYATSTLSRLANSYDAIGCGPGMTTGNGSTALVERLMHDSTPRVLDADALNCLADLAWEASASGPLVLTPHPGEFQRISGVGASDRRAQVNAAESLATETGSVIVLKGGPTVVLGGPDEQGQTEWINTTGNPGMATAGSGDVLTGIITSLLGQGLSPLQAARLGVWVHGLAGDIATKSVGQAGLTCTDIVAALPEAIVAAGPDS